ncbi:MAG: hypothetical protein Q9209_003758 [Squamulea sp. 1 TL-2023]
MGALLATVPSNGLVIPPESSDRTSTLSQANSSNLNAGVPPAFKVDITSNTDVPINPEEIWRASLNMMFRVTDFALTDTWLDKTFPSPIGSSAILLTSGSTGKEPSRLTSQHVIWGLNHLMLSMLLSKKYCQTAAVLKWEGVRIGILEIAARQRLELVSDSGSDRTTRLSHFFDKDISLRDIVYGQTPIERYLVYLTAIRAMGEAAQKGLDTPVPAMFTRGIQLVSWSLIHQAGSPGLKAGHSRITVYTALANMVRDNRFSEMYLVLDVRGEKFAIGRFGQGSSDAAILRSMA